MAYDLVNCFDLTLPVWSAVIHLAMLLISPVHGLLGDAIFVRVVSLLVGVVVHATG
jgi:hypothetical protein